MASIRQRFNPKRCFSSELPSKEALERLANQLSYGGNPAHKRNPGDFGLTPPTQPRDDKSLCDDAGILKRDEALRLLRLGAQRGMISEWNGEGFPRNIWAVTEAGIPLEAQLENPEKGSYHGYPLEGNDDFRPRVLARWEQQP